MPTKARKSTDLIVRRLRSLTLESPALKSAAKVYEAVLPLLRDADLHAGTISLTAQEMRSKIEKGVHLLQNVQIEFDIEAVLELMIKLADAIERATNKNKLHKLHLPWQTVNHSAAGRIRLALEERRLDIRDLLAHIAAGEKERLASAVERLGLDAGLVWSLAENALKPVLRSWCRQLSPLVEGFPWNKGTCFVCAAPAILGELQDNAQVKHLRCGACGADWQFRRLQCMYCGNEDHEAQRYLYEEKEKDKMRVEVCDKCRGYLKVISAFSPTPSDMLAVEDLATIHLDYIAQERGYARREIR